MKSGVAIGLALAVGLAAGALGFGLGRESGGGGGEHAGAGGLSAPTVYTCSMHPQIRLPGPGTCPICEMPLTPLGAGGGVTGGEGDAPPALELDAHALAMASVETVAVERRPFRSSIRAVGKIQYNEASLATITARVDGYAEKLFVGFTGVEIKKGDHLAEIYSPDLLVAEQELLLALQSGAAGKPLVDATRLKLKLWGLTEAQIDDLVRAQRISERVTLYSPITGTVIEKPIIESAAFEAGDVLYQVANLDTVWVYLDIYEYDLAWVRYGQTVDIEAEAYPGQRFRGVVTFIQPVLDDRSRTVRVPVHIDNRDHRLKPGMFVSATIRAALGPDGRAAPTGVEGRYTCTMHPHVLVDAAGRCPDCAMPLERIPGGVAAGDGAAGPPAPRFGCPMRCEGDRTYDDPATRCPVCEMRLERVESEAEARARGLIAVPASAVLDSGARRLVYVASGRARFEPREVTLGPRADGWVVVLEGLREGERVVTRGGFLIDSQMQITGHPSLFYPGGLYAGQGGAGAPARAGDAPADRDARGGAGGHGEGGHGAHDGPGAPPPAGHGR